MPSNNVCVKNKIIIMRNNILSITFFRFLVLEYVGGGELFDYLVSKGRLHILEVSIFYTELCRYLLKLTIFPLMLICN